MPQDGICDRILSLSGIILYKPLAIDKCVILASQDASVLSYFLEACREL